MSGAARLSRPLSLLWGAAAALVAVAGPLSTARLGRGLATLPACPLRGLVGWPCPACGSGRALAALAAGGVFEAFAWNPLAALFVLGFVVGGLVAALAALAGRPLAEARALPVAARAGFVAALALDWIYLAWVGR